MTSVIEVHERGIKTPVLRCRGLRKSFGSRHVLRDMGFSLDGGGLVAIIGPNGSGKTTLLDILSGFLRPDAGTIEIGDVDVSDATPSSIARRGVGRSFQQTRVVRALTVRENLESAAGAARAQYEYFGIPRRRVERMAAVDDIMGRTGLKDLQARLAGTLSFGQQKLLAMAICLVREPDLYLLDEPFAGVDSVVSDKIVGILGTLTHKAVLFVEHDFTTVQTVASRVLLLSGGRIAADGPPEEIFSGNAFAAAYGIAR